MAKPGKRGGRKRSGTKRVGKKSAGRTTTPSVSPRKEGTTATRKPRAAAASEAPKPVPPPVPPPPNDLEPAEPPTLGDIPWGYGQNRVTALPRDPHWIFVYWELTDEAIAEARGRVRATDAACVLRVYDTTWRLFDGTNANWFFDVPVHRPATNHYVCVNRPAAVFHVDIGVKSPAGAFATIARSAPVETPRDSISPDTSVEWMTVTAGGAPPPEYRHRVPPGREARAAATAAGHDLDLERVMHALVGEGWSRTEGAAREGRGRVVRWVRWAGPRRHEHWRTVVDERVEVVFAGERRVLAGAWGERLVVGPWRVTIHAVGPAGERRLIDCWTIHYAWPTEGGLVRVDTGSILARIVRGYRTAALGQGSEARLVEAAWGSEALLAGASEGFVR